MYDYSIKVGMDDPAVEANRDNAQGISFISKLYDPKIPFLMQQKFRSSISLVLLSEGNQNAQCLHPQRAT